MRCFAELLNLRAPVSFGREKIKTLENTHHALLGLMILSGGSLQMPTWFRYGFWPVVLED